MLQKQLRLPLLGIIITLTVIVVLVALRDSLSTQLFGATRTAELQNATPAETQKQPQDPPDEKPPRAADPQAGFMRLKLQASGSILEGLCTEDMGLVGTGCDQLLKMSLEERWRVSGDGVYRRYSREFQDAVEELKQESADEDLHGTSLAWINVTMKCLKCHEWVRTVVLAEQEPQQ